MIDLRNIYNPKEMESAGFAYSCVGRGEIKLGKINAK
jgi:UDPglucose 6-dehydrogenase